VDGTWLVVDSKAMRRCHFEAKGVAGFTIIACVLHLLWVQAKVAGGKRAVCITVTCCGE